jgi:glycosyltransferase involved in cell wall biosynthesis
LKEGTGPRRRRLCFVVSHPIQYLVPLYRRLSSRGDVDIKVFFTWHAGGQPVEDRGFGQKIEWDIPLTDGYDFELVPNVSFRPGPYHFFGLRNPALLDRVMSWRADVVHISGWAWYSHLRLLRSLHRRGVRTLFLGDSHLLDGAPAGVRGWAKAAVLRRVYSWPSGFLVVGSASRAYYAHFGVDPPRLYRSPHCIDVGRFGEPPADLEQQAARWRLQLGIAPEQKVLLYAGKFESKKRPTELMRAVARLRDSAIVLVMVGAGELQAEINSLAAADPSLFRVLPFQNQSRMPVVYRLGDVFVLPSGHGETWGLAVNEALACGRPAIVSDRVGCASEVIDSTCGRLFRWDDWSEFNRLVAELAHGDAELAAMKRGALERARAFDIAVTERAVIAAVNDLCRSNLVR